jgi:hypothetical protein
MTHSSGREVVLEDDMVGGGPTLAKHRATERVETNPASLIRNGNLSRQKLHLRFQTPPPPA